MAATNIAAPPKTDPFKSWIPRAKISCRGLYDVQEVRIQMGNRIAGLVRGGHMSEQEASKYFEIAFKHFVDAELEMEKKMWREIKGLPIVQEWLGRITGIGRRLAGLLIANIGDIARFGNVAKLWYYAGQHVEDRLFFKGTNPDPQLWRSVLLDWYREDHENKFIEYKTKTFEWVEDTEPGADGKFRRHLECTIGELQTVSMDKAEIRHCAPKRRRGEVSNWNQELRVTCWKIGSSFIKAKTSKYRELYYSYKERIIKRELAKGNIIWKSNAAGGKWTAEYVPEGVTPPKRSTKKDRVWTLGRIHLMAVRYTSKIFLSHLWQVWREIEGLPVRAPYVIEKLGHTTFLDPWDFVKDPENNVKRPDVMNAPVDIDAQAAIEDDDFDPNM